MVKSEIYLFVSAFEHNGEGPMANQVLPAELKPPDRLHGSLVNSCCCVQTGPRRRLSDRSRCSPTSMPQATPMLLAKSVVLAAGRHCCRKYKHRQAHVEVLLKQASN